MSNTNFSNLIQPLKLDSFLEEYWEKFPLFLPRNNPDYYSEIVSVNDIDSIIYCSNANSMAFNKGKPTFQSNKKNTIYDLYKNYYEGDTVTVYGLNQCWKPVSFFCRNLESFFKCHVHANLYLTPKSSQGLAPHFDSHDVFVLQLEGEKHWCVYDQTSQTFPLFMDETIDYQVPRNQLPSCLEEVTLQKGDMLYIPRGFVHEAFTSESLSAHLTVGVNTYKWIDLISQAFVIATKRNESFRRSLPIGFLDKEFLNSKDNLALFKKNSEELLEILQDKKLMEDARNEINKRFFANLQPLPDGHFAQIDKIDKVDLDTVVTKREGLFNNILSTEDTTSIEFPGNVIIGPSHIKEAFHNINDLEQFTVKDISENLTDKSKLVLARRLIKEGLIKTVS